MIGGIKKIVCFGLKKSNNTINPRIVYSQFKKFSYLNDLEVLQSKVNRQSQEFQVKMI